MLPCGKGFDRGITATATAPPNCRRTLPAAAAQKCAVCTKCTSGPCYTNRECVTGFDCNTEFIGSKCNSRLVQPAAHSCTVSTAVVCSGSVLLY